MFCNIYKHTQQTYEPSFIREQADEGRGFTS